MCMCACVRAREQAFMRVCVIVYDDRESIGECVTLFLLVNM